MSSSKLCFNKKDKKDANDKQCKYCKDRDLSAKRCLYCGNSIPKRKKIKEEDNSKKNSSG